MYFSMMILIFCLNRGGYCSRLYLCQNVSSNNNSNTDVATNSGVKAAKEYSKFLIRLYGGKVLDEDSPMIVLSRESQALFYYEMGVNSQGPKLLGAFKDGRLEEFIESHTLTPEDMLTGIDGGREIRAQVARRLARYHHIRQSIPLSTRRLAHYEGFEAFYQMYDTEDGRATFKRGCENAGFDTEWISRYDWQKEIAWLKETEPKIATRDVMCNNDMKMDNCLVRNTPDKLGERIVLIDYEISSMNPRGSDIGHHFAMWTIDFTNKGGSFMSKYDYPSEDMRREFVIEYLKETKKVADYELEENGLDSVDHVMMEADFFGLKIIHFWISMGMMKKPELSAWLDESSAIGFLVSHSENNFS